MPRYIDADKIPYFHYSGDNTAAEGVDYALKGVIESRVPTEDVVPVVHGHWESSELLCENGCTTCSRCKTEYYISDLEQIGGDTLPPHCPNCGAIMDRKDEVEDNA